MRKSEVYISNENRRACAIIARSKGLPTADEVADDLLAWAIAQRHPGLGEFQKEIQAIEEKMLEAVKS